LFFLQYRALTVEFLPRNAFSERSGERLAFKFLPASQFFYLFPLCHTAPLAAFFLIAEMFRFGFDIGVPMLVALIRSVEELRDFLLL
jgi:hypothetical protein